MKKIFILLAVAINILCFSSKAQNKLNVGDVIAIWDTIDFDSTGRFIHIDTSSQNIWQIGHPQKTFFDSTYSTQKAMVTDTANNYPPKNHSYFDLYVGPFNNQMYHFDVFIDFWHKFDTDTLKDGGYITVSWDRGLTFMNIIKDTVYIGGSPTHDFFPFNPSDLYDTTNTLFNGQYGFSGRSKQWVHTAFGWHYYLIKPDILPDTMIIRFNFISDSINNPKEGWMIDHLRLYSIDLGGGINKISGEGSVSISPNPFTTSAQITLNKTYHNIDLAVYDIQGKLMAQYQYADCDKIQFKRNHLNPGLYFLKLTLDDKRVETGKIVVGDEE